MTEITTCASKKSNRSKANGARYQVAAASVAIIAVLYNAVLAIINCHVVTLSFSIVASAEFLILIVAAWLIAIDGVRAFDYPSLALLYAGAVIAVLISLVSTKVFVDGMRVTMIIGVFTMLGSRIKLKGLRVTFNICASVALVVLLLEMFALSTYASLFRPLDYFAATRGYPLPEWQLESGLAAGTGNYAGRFSIGFWTGPRTSTIFLEQTGINAFSIILMVYLTSMFNRISNTERCLLAFTILLIIVTNNARMATIMVSVFIGGYFIFPKLTNRLTIGLCIAAILTTFILFQFHSEDRGDTLVGRLWVTYNYLVNTGFSEFIVGNPQRRLKAMDTGYGYLVASTTLLGAIIYCVYIGFIVPDNSADHRRLGWGVASYLYLWLLVGGTSSSSIKTAALLWLLVGYFVRQDLDSRIAVQSSKPDSDCFRYS